jgi:hypothetical protein
MSNSFHDFVRLHLIPSDPVETAGLKPVTIRLTPSQIGHLGFLASQLNITRQALMHEMICQGIEGVISEILGFCDSDDSRHEFLDGLRGASDLENQQ